MPPVKTLSAVLQLPCHTRRISCPGGFVRYDPDVNEKPSGWIRNWQLRHQTPLSFWLHMIGIPLVLAAVVLAGWQLYHWRWDLWWRPCLLLALGYLLQYLGHRREGNDVGEIILIKRLLGRPYIDIAPQFQKLATEARRHGEKA